MGIWRVILAALVLMGCNAGAPSGSPRAVAETVVGAFDTGDVARFMSVLPSEDQLGAAFDCGRADTLRAALRRRLDDIQSEFEARRMANFRMRLLAFDLDGSETSALGSGDVYQGCTVRAPVTVHRSRVSLSRKRGGRNDDSTDTWTFLRFEPEGPWYYGKF